MQPDCERKEPGKRKKRKQRILAYYFKNKIMHVHTKNLYFAINISVIFLVGMYSKNLIPYHTLATILTTQ